jgi:hypothetical protein
MPFKASSPYCSNSGRTDPTGCQTWSLALSEEHILRVSERMFRPKRDEVTGGWIKLHNLEFHSLYSSPNNMKVIKSRRMRLAGQVARTEQMRNEYKILVGKPEGERPLGRPRR